MISHAFSVHGPLKIHWPQHDSVTHSLSPAPSVQSLMYSVYTLPHCIFQNWWTLNACESLNFTSMPHASPCFEAKLAQWLANRSLPSSIYFAILHWLVGGLDTPEKAVSGSSHGLNYWKQPMLGQGDRSGKRFFSTRIFCTKTCQCKSLGFPHWMGAGNMTSSARSPSALCSGCLPAFPFLAFTRKQHGGSNSLSCHPIFAR